MFDLGARLARTFPLAFTRALAATLGWLYARTHPAKVAVVAKNLRLLDPSLGDAEARKVYGEFGRTLADYFYIGTRSRSEAATLVADFEGLEHLRAAQKLGRGAIIVTAHFGLFELGGLLLAEHGFPAVVLTYPEPSRALTAWRAAFRRRWGVETLEIGGDSFAFLAIDGRLRAGQFVATLIDRPHPTDRTTVALPNGTAQFSAGIFLLAAHGGVPVIPATMVRRRDGRYHAKVFAPLMIEERATRAETLLFYSQRVADLLLPALHAHPTQWYQFVPLSTP
jgi:KDO2-lipid IV(A) lauroyltransferase